MSLVDVMKSLQSKKVVRKIPLGKSDVNFKLL